MATLFRPELRAPEWRTLGQRPAGPWAVVVNSGEDERVTADAVDQPEPAVHRCHLRPRRQVLFRTWEVTCDKCGTLTTGRSHWFAKYVSLRHRLLTRKRAKRA